MYNNLQVCLLLHFFLFENSCQLQTPFSGSFKYARFSRNHHFLHLLPPKQAMSTAVPPESPATANSKKRKEPDTAQDATHDELDPEPGSSVPGTSSWCSTLSGPRSSHPTFLRAIHILAPAKRGPGRPRKNPAAPTTPAALTAEGEEPPKRKRGRPPRVSYPPMSMFAHLF